MLASSCLMANTVPGVQVLRLQKVLESDQIQSMAFGPNLISSLEYIKFPKEEKTLPDFDRYILGYTDYDKISGQEVLCEIELTFDSNRVVHASEPDCKS